MGAEPSLALVVTVEGKAVRLSSREKWLRAILQGDLTEATIVEIEANGLPVRKCPAGEVEELRDLFQAASRPKAAPPAPPAAIRVHDSPIQTTEEKTASPERLPRPADDTRPAPAPKASPHPKNPNASRWAPRIAGAIGIALFIGMVRLLAADNSSPPPLAAVSPEDGNLIEPAAPAGKAVSDGELVNWSADAGADGSSFVDGDLHITMSAAALPNDGVAPKLTVEGYGLPPTEVMGAEGRSPAGGSFMIGQLDPTTPEPEVIFTSFSGGAHCCTQITVLQRDGDTWKSIDLGHWDGEPLQEWPKDVDGDGTPDLIMRDERFLYAFTSYASSFAPPIIINLRHGKASNVSADARFNPVFESEMTGAEASCRQKNNGACAAMVAIAARLGRVEGAWDQMLANYDPDFQWDLPTGCRVDPGDAACPAGLEIKYSEYPEALLNFLKVTGYLPATFSPAPAGASATTSNSY